jgi:hypothetical protein
VTADQRIPSVITSHNEVYYTTVETIAWFRAIYDSG